jgi:hypothetical protein
MRTRRQQQQQLGSQSLSQPPLFELATPHDGLQMEPFARQIEAVNDLVGRSRGDDTWQSECPWEDYGADIDSDVEFWSGDEGEEEELL